MSDSSPLRGYTAFAQIRSDELFTGQPDLLQPGEEIDFGQSSNHGYLGNHVGLSKANQVHGNFGTYGQPRPLYDIHGGNFAPPYEDALLGSAHQLDYGNIVTGPQGPWPSTYGPDLFPGSDMPESALGGGLELEADFDNHWLTDGSLFLLPGWDTTISADQPEYPPVRSFEPCGLAKQTWATPFLHAGTQQLSGGPRGYLPIEDLNTLAQAR